MTTSSRPTCTPVQFYIDTPLYEKVIFNNEDDVSPYNILFFDQPFDAFCEGCNKHTIFQRVSDNNRPAQSSSWLDYPRRTATFRCSRDSHHLLFFLVNIDGEERSLEKIGQYPSLATLSMYDVKQYQTVLAKDTFRELTKAIGLAAHGVGIGSFVYLRRIFEGLVEEAHVEAMVQRDWDDELYGKSRMGEKIELLADYLPSFLVENKSMYGILSKGIHELSEDVCLAAFPVVKVGIEIILDAKIEEAAAKKKLASARLAIQQLTSAAAGK